MVHSWTSTLKRKQYCAEQYHLEPQGKFRCIGCNFDYISWDLARTLGLRPPTTDCHSTILRTLILLPKRYYHKNTVEANNATFFSIGINSFCCCCCFVTQISSPYITYVQKHSIWYVQSSAGPYMQYKNIQNRKHILMELTNHYWRWLMRIIQNNIITTTCTNHMPGMVLSPLYTDSFMYFKGFKTFIYILYTSYIVFLK